MESLSSLLARPAWLVNRLFIWIPIQQRRKRLSRQINNLFDSTIAYGPFKGQKLTRRNWWGVKDRASMIFGLYEHEVLNSLMSVPSQYKTFIDLGAADGYYGIGALVSGKFERTYCFEISPEGRRVIAENAVLNKVADQMTVHGIADSDFSKLIPLNQIDKSVLLIDIEGAEFSLCTREMFCAFQNSIIFIEVHSLFYDDGADRQAQLKATAEEFFVVSELTTGNRDPSQFPELDDYEDTDRWLICSEGRQKRMTWFRLDPK